MSAISLIRNNSRKGSSVRQISYRSTGMTELPTFRVTKRGESRARTCFRMKVERVVCAARRSASRLASGAISVYRITCVSIDVLVQFDLE